MARYRDSSFQKASEPLLIQPEIIITSLKTGYEKRANHTVIRKIAQLRRTVNKRRQRDDRDHSERKRFYRGTSLVIVAVILFGILTPLVAGIAAYNVYTHVYSITQDGVNHLLRVKALFPINKNDAMADLDTGKLQLAHHELTSAESDFVQLQQLVNRPDVQSTIEQVSPEYGHKLIMASHLVQVAIDISRMGQEMTNIGVIGARIIHGSPLASNSTTPLISVADLATIEGTVVHAIYYIDDIQTQMSQVQLNDLPISTRQVTQLAGILAELPMVRDMLTQAQDMTECNRLASGCRTRTAFLSSDNGSCRTAPRRRFHRTIWYPPDTRWTYGTFQLAGRGPARLRWQWYGIGSFCATRV